MLRGLWNTSLVSKSNLRTRAARPDRHGRRTRARVRHRRPGARRGQHAARLADTRVRDGGVYTVLVSILIAISAVLSLHGRMHLLNLPRRRNMKRLRATPLRPYTILGAHVLVKLLLSAGTLVLVAATGERPVGRRPHTDDLVHGRPAVDDVERPVDGFLDRKRHSDRAIRAANRCRNSLSDAGTLRPVQSAELASAGPANRRQDVAADLCRLTAQGHLARRGLVRAHRQRPGAGGSGPLLHSPLPRCFAGG